MTRHACGGLSLRCLVPYYRCPPTTRARIQHLLSNAILHEELTSKVGELDAASPSSPTPRELSPGPDACHFFFGRLLRALSWMRGCCSGGVPRAPLPAPVLRE
jgi:hypothetical protein